MREPPPGGRDGRICPKGLARVLCLVSFRSSPGSVSFRHCENVPPETPSGSGADTENDDCSNREIKADIMPDVAQRIEKRPQDTKAQGRRKTHDFEQFPFVPFFAHNAGDKRQRLPVKSRFSRPARRPGASHLLASYSSNLGQNRLNRIAKTLSPQGCPQEST
jgi:hypothetical protein